MTRSERINNMMLFLNDRKTFNLKDLMEKYGISKSTALRDVAALGNVGMPIYAQQGRNGHYGILPNKLLSPIIFSVDEVFAMYFSMLTLRDYQSTPFHLSVEDLKKKFEGCLSLNNINMLRRIEGVLSLTSVQHANPSPFLRDVVRYAVEETVCEVAYSKNAEFLKYVIQFYGVSSSYGQWYATGYNVETNRPKVFRCDRIQAISPLPDDSPKSLDWLLQNSGAINKQPGATDFEVEVSQKGVDYYYKEHYPSMTLQMDQGRAYVHGFYNKSEEAFISDYFIAYGESVLSVRPQSLKKMIEQRLKSLQTHYSDI
ncbi:MAG: YafY family transcriptional regulator [Chloroflexi bacterium]|nr:YafY family transcriptional regulator [Chloroflexota bacterium]